MKTKLNEDKFKLDINVKISKNMGEICQNTIG